MILVWSHNVQKVSHTKVAIHIPQWFPFIAKDKNHWFKSFFMDMKDSFFGHFIHLSSPFRNSCLDYQISTYIIINPYVSSLLYSLLFLILQVHINQVLSKPRTFTRFSWCNLVLSSKYGVFRCHYSTTHKPMNYPTYFPLLLYFCSSPTF